ncbi:MAG TPA: GNVR domain-containing protein [Pyrinomonadaceae bacterium]|nr:GNVR domain-containing protein [Pyrinomonadaceae bacterium]
MSVEFRQRTPGEYARMVWRRKWLIALPTAAVAVAVAWVVWRLPNTYESRTLLTVRPASISASVVPQLSDSDLTIRINNIGQEVVSRSSLEPLIEKYDLYASERRRGEPMDTLVERMRTQDVVVEINTARNDVINGFYLAFRGPEPRVTQAVTAELASKYVTAQNKAAGEESTLTKEFFEQKLREKKEELDAIDNRRLEFMLRNKEHLPSAAQALIGQLAGLREQQKGILGSLGMLRERRSLLNTQLGDLGKQREQEIVNVAEQVGDPKQTLAYAELAKRKAQLESERQNLLTIYKPKHPDVIAKQAELDSVQREIDTMLAESKEKIEEKRKKLEGLIDPRRKTLEYELKTSETQLGVMEKQLAMTERQIADVEQRLNGMPGTEVGLEAINREYASAKAVYETMLAQQQKAELGADIVSSAQGETIAVIDPASLPERPVAPKRPFLMLLGLAAGLGCGLLLAAAFEVPRLLTVQTTEDAEHYTGLPVLAALPNLRTPGEERSLRLRRAALAVAGVALAVVSVPALALILGATRVMEIFT